MPLSRLLYSSQCALMGDETTRNAMVRELVAEAAKANQHNKITGTLLWVNDQFIQVLEGPAANIEVTFEAICRDFRHQAIELIDLSSVKTRMFKNWSIALLSDQDASGFDRAGEIAQIQATLASNAPAALKMLRAMLQEHCDREAA